MQIIHYPTEAAFRTRLQPLLDAAPDINPHLLTLQLHEGLLRVSAQAGTDEIFLRADHKGYWLPSGTNAALCVELLKALNVTHAPVGFFADLKVGEAAQDYFSQLGASPREAIPMHWYRMTELQNVKLPDSTLRLAVAEDSAILVDFLSAFEAEALGITDHSRTQQQISFMLSAKQAYLLAVNGQPVAMALAFDNGPGLKRLGGIYTPPALRGQGYGKAVTAKLCQSILESGSHVALHADATHAFTNQLYQALGFAHKGQHLTLIYK